MYRCGSLININPSGVYKSSFSAIKNAAAIQAIRWWENLANKQAWKLSENEILTLLSHKKTVSLW